MSPRVYDICVPLLSDVIIARVQIKSIKNPAVRAGDAHESR